MTSNVRVNGAAVRELMLSSEVQTLLQSEAERVAASANAKAYSVMHTPSIAPYRASVRTTPNCAIGTVIGVGRPQNGTSTGLTIGAALENKYKCLTSSL